MVIWRQPQDELNMLLVGSTQIAAPPRDVFQFFEAMEENYTRWHPDHIPFRWLGGGRLESGSRAYFEKRIGGELQKKTVEFTEVDPDHYIEFKPDSRLVAVLIPHISFTIDPRPDGCEVTQRIRVRTGPVGAWLNRREFDAVRKHVREEGKNLKRILEEGSKIPSNA